MPIAFVLVNAEIGTEHTVLEELKTVDGVKEAYIVYGVYDVVCKLEMSNMGTLKETIVSRIRTLNNVRSTLTMVGMDDTA